jgi:hypothetical protein
LAGLVEKKEERRGGVLGFFCGGLNRRSWATGTIPAIGGIERQGELHGAASSRREEEERGFL